MELFSGASRSHPPLKEKEEKKEENIFIKFFVITGGRSRCFKVVAGDKVLEAFTVFTIFK